MKRLAVINEARKARAAWNKTLAGRLNALFAEQTKWQRRQTIAANKLSDVRYKIKEMAFDLAKGGQP